LTFEIASMKTRTLVSSWLWIWGLCHSPVAGFTVPLATPRLIASSSSSSSLRMGLFDGVKDAFSAPALERTTIDAERETPIDRWMGWSVAKENKSDNESTVVAVRARTFMCVLERKGTASGELGLTLCLLFYFRVNLDV
jgi:hypothetical protein